MRNSTIVLTLCDEGHVMDYVLDQPQTWIVGRARDCDIQLPADDVHVDVSRYHCQIEADPPLVRVRDLGSTNGTFVNGELIGAGPLPRGATPDSALPAWELTDGDEIRVGGAVLHVRVSAAAEADADQEMAAGTFFYVPQVT